MPNPYPGLRPFRRDEFRLFAGRETIADSVTTRLRVSPLTLMFARSGVGKSSFLNCRLIPYIAAESAVRYLNEWGSDAPERLIDEQLQTFAREPASAERPVLVLDQFEDVFKADTSRQSLWDCLASVTNVSDSPAHLLISMREEWLGAWQEAEDYLPDALNCLLRLRPLGENEVLRAILNPAAEEGSVRFEPTLAQTLIRDLKRPFAFGLSGSMVEPGLLQLVCRRLWAEATRREVPTATVELYDELGGADMIVREFVWNELGSAGMEEKEIPDPDRPVPRFGAADRVLWAGLTRHLIVSQGVKSIVSSEGLARSLLMADLGVAGRAVVSDEAPYGLNYLDTPPEKREAPPVDLVSWIEDVLEVAVDVGFMKRQRRLVVDEAETELESTDSEPEQEPSTAVDLESTDEGNEFEDENGEDENGADTAAIEDSEHEVEQLELDESEELRGRGKYIYELSHDALADILQVFKIEFEGWIRTKAAKLLGVFFGVVVVLPLLFVLVASTSFEDLASILLTIVGGIVLGIFYVAAMWLITAIFKIVGDVIMRPIYRRLARGRIPIAKIQRPR